MDTTEAERIAYVSGQTAIAELLARIADLEAQIAALQSKEEE